MVKFPREACGAMPEARASRFGPEAIAIPGRVG